MCFSIIWTWITFWTLYSLLSLIFILALLIYSLIQSSSVQSLRCVWLFAIPWTAARQASMAITNSQSLLKLMSIESMMTSNHLILCHPLLFSPSIFPSIRVFSNVSALRIRWPKYWSFSFNISPSNEHPGLISFRMDWLDLLAVQGTLKSLLRHHSSKASILWCSALFDCSLITLWLLSDHSLITLWLLSDHFSITLWLLSDHSLITLWSLSDHSLITEL